MLVGAPVWSTGIDDDFHIACHKWIAKAFAGITPSGSNTIEYFHHGIGLYKLYG